MRVIPGLIPCAGILRGRRIRGLCDFAAVGAPCRFETMAARLPPGKATGIRSRYRSRGARRSHEFNPCEFNRTLLGSTGPSGAAPAVRFMGKHGWLGGRHPVRGPCHRSVSTMYTEAVVRSKPRKTGIFSPWGCGRRGNWRTLWSPCRAFAESGRTAAPADGNRCNHGFNDRRTESGPPGGFHSPHLPDDAVYLKLVVGGAPV